MQLTEFRARLRGAERSARARQQERLVMRDDTPWHEQVTQEFIMELIERVERLESMLLPPEEQPEKPVHAKQDL